MAKANRRREELTLEQKRHLSTQWGILLSNLQAMHTRLYRVGLLRKRLVLTAGVKKIG